VNVAEHNLQIAAGGGKVRRPDGFVDRHHIPVDAGVGVRNIDDALWRMQTPKESEEKVTKKKKKVNHAH
jgi:hypothetical protein